MDDMADYPFYFWFARSKGEEVVVLLIEQKNDMWFYRCDRCGFEIGINVKEVPVEDAGRGFADHVNQWYCKKKNSED